MSCSCPAYVHSMSPDLPVTGCEQDQEREKSLAWRLLQIRAEGYSRTYR